MPSFSKRPKGGHVHGDIGGFGIVCFTDVVIERNLECAGKPIPSSKSVNTFWIK
jgi:hypothetical protein